MFALKAFGGTGKPQYLELSSDEKVSKKGALPLTWNEELLEAVKLKRLQEVKELVAKTQWDPYGPYVPVAAQWGHAEIVDELAKAKASMDAMLWGKPAIMLAAENDQVKCVELIVKHGGSKDALDLDGETALSRADSYGHQPVCDFLREVGAKEFSLRGLLKKQDVAAVHHWVEAGATEDGGSIEERDRRSALVDEVARCSGDEVMLLLAAQAGDLVSVKRLVEDEAVDPETKSADGKTPLELAAREGHIAVVQYLSLYADHGQVKAILAGLRQAKEPSAKRMISKEAGKLGKKKKNSKKNSRMESSTMSSQEKSSASIDVGDE